MYDPSRHDPRHGRLPPPEQVRGKPGTADADIWAFGVFSWVITGQRMFQGDDVTEPWPPCPQAVPEGVPVESPPLEKVSGEGLKRLRDIGGMGAARGTWHRPSACASPPSPSRLGPGRAPWVAVAWRRWRFSLREIRPRHTRATIAPPEPREAFFGFAVSPDGRAHIGRGEWRNVSFGTAHGRSGGHAWHEDARYPFMIIGQPQHRVFADGKLRRSRPKGRPADLRFRRLARRRAATT